MTSVENTLVKLDKICSKLEKEIEPELNKNSKEYDLYLSAMILISKLQLELNSQVIKYLRRERKAKDVL